MADIPDPSREIGALIRQLDDPDGDVRDRAAEALGDMGPAALPALVAALNVRSTQKRLGAIAAIGRIRDPAAVVPLSAFICHETEIETRAAAVLALGETGDRSVIPLCETLLQDPDRYLRYSAAVTLGKLLWGPGDPEEWAYYFIALQDWDGLAAIGSAANGPMRAMLKDDDANVRIHLMDLLSRNGGPDAAEGCVRLLKDSRDTIRYMAVLSAIKAGLTADRIPLIVMQRERTGPKPAVAALLNFLFLGIGYNYMGKWWGFLVFMSYMSILVLAQLSLGPFLPYLIAYPITALIAVQTYRETKQMAEVS